MTNNLFWRGSTSCRLFN